MLNKINLYLLEYAIGSILRNRYKSIFIMVIFTFLTFLLSSVFFISNSIKYELNSTVKSLPQITVQKIKAGRHYDIDVRAIDQILELNGVSDAIARVWGYYYFENAGVNFSIVGLNQYENQYKSSLENLTNKFDLNNNSKNRSMIVGQGVLKILNENYYDKYFNFIKPDGKFLQVDIGGVFDYDIQLESNDLIVLDQTVAREIMGLPEDKATDIVVKVANPTEIPMVASKIKLLFPDTRVITNEDLQVSYDNIFDYKSGIFLALFIVSLFTFFIIIYDKSSGLTSQEKREIGILKAVGWTVDDILKEKFYEAFIISFISYLIGVILAFGFVYIFQAPILRDIFVGYSLLKTDFILPFVFDFQTLFLVFFLSVPVYIAATIIPSWKAATIEADEAIR
jgi:ABC-type lipoprotein release transport system permease subunit